MLKREGYESRKNWLYENEVKSPVLFLMDNQQPSPDEGKVQRLSRRQVNPCNRSTAQVGG